MNLVELRSDECRFEEPVVPIALLPIGAVEQHSRHLPLGTDAMIVEAVATEVERRLPARVLLLPTLAVGASDHHLAMPGTLSAGTRSVAETVSRQILSLFRSAGVASFLILNGHGGNQPAVRLAIEDVHDADAGLRVHGVDYWSAMFDVLDREGIPRPAGMGHADVIETSILLAIHPHLVAVDRMRADSYCDRLPPWTHVSAGIPERTRFGGVGDPSDASAERGRGLLDAAADGVVDLIDRIAAS